MFRSFINILGFCPRLFIDAYRSLEQLAACGYLRRSSSYVGVVDRGFGHASMTNTGGSSNKCACLMKSGAFLWSGICVIAFYMWSALSTLLYIVGFPVDSCTASVSRGCQTVSAKVKACGDGIFGCCRRTASVVPGLTSTPSPYESLPTRDEELGSVHSPVGSGLSMVSGSSGAATIGNSNSSSSGGAHNSNKLVSSGTAATVSMPGKGHKLGGGGGGTGVSRLVEQAIASKKTPTSTGNSGGL
jgi:hypothetical protein